MTARGVGRWPDLFVVGAGRSGTTALHQHLGAHPLIRTSDHKSPNHFATGIGQPPWETPVAVAMARHWVDDPADYLGLFSGAGDDHVLVDVSPVYLQTTLAAGRIRDVNPTARIVAILRDPAERAHAHFLGRRRDGIEHHTDLGAWLDEYGDGPLPDEVAFGHYVGCGRYHHFLMPYLDQFGPDGVLIVFHDDLLADPVVVVDRILGFVGLDPIAAGTRSMIDVDARPNRSGEITNPVLRRVWTASAPARTRLRPYLPERIRRAVGAKVLADLERDPLRPAWRSRMIDRLRPDIEALAGLTGRDLTSWLD